MDQSIMSVSLSSISSQTLLLQRLRSLSDASATTKPTDGVSSAAAVSSASAPSIKTGGTAPIGAALSAFLAQLMGSSFVTAERSSDRTLASGGTTTESGNAALLARAQDAYDDVTA